LELEIFLATQALLGIGLGIAISRQQHLAQNLHHYRKRLEAELQARRVLAENLSIPKRTPAKVSPANCTTKLARILPPSKSSHSW
jgi:hypothetical protein